MGRRSLTHWVNCWYNGGSTYSAARHFLQVKSRRKMPWLPIDDFNLLRWQRGEDSLLGDFLIPPKPQLVKHNPFLGDGVYLLPVLRETCPD